MSDPTARLALATRLKSAYGDSGECRHGFLYSSGCPNDDCTQQAAYDASIEIERVRLARRADIRDAANRIVNMDFYTEDIIDKMRAEARKIVDLCK